MLASSRVLRRRCAQTLKGNSLTKTLRTYHMTVASTWYDKTAGGAKEYELHFTVARSGQIRTVRRKLARRGLVYFQGLVYRRTKNWIRKRRIKARFEREEAANKTESRIRVDGRSMLFRGRQWKAYPLGTKELSYARKRKRRVA